MQTSNIKLIVTVDDQHLVQIERVADKLAAAGLKIESILRTGGIITGSVSQELQTKLQAIEGVLSVETDTEMRAL